jgi:DNA-3-methyladenine glycosylase I
MAARAERVRCGWCGQDPLYVDYHDTEWGVPLHDDTRLFEMLTLEGAQAGLSWITILRKRQAYRAAFDVHTIARYGERRVETLLNNPGIVRNRLKVAATVSNAQALLDLLEREDSFDSYLWQFVDGRPINNHRTGMSEVPTRTAQSDAMSRDLKRRGFRFVGSTICYAFMQATGMVNDHLTDCFRHRELSAAAPR